MPDLWGRPTVKAGVGTSRDFKLASLLVDTGAALNTMHPDLATRGLCTPEARVLSGFGGGSHRAKIWKDIPLSVGTLATSLEVCENQGEDDGILGMPFLREHKITVDLAGGLLWSLEDGPQEISAIHRCAALKVPAPLATVSDDPWTQDFPEVWVTDKAECGTVKDACVFIEGKDPPPQRQYKYPAEAEEGIGKTIKGLLEWDVIIPMQSICNAPLWPVLKADGVTWRMTVDFRALNALTPPVAPVVAKYNEILAAIAAGSKYYSVIDLANAFHSIKLDPRCWYKFAFTFRGQQFAFKRTPQGFHSSPSICHAHVVQMWEELLPESKPHVLSYVDDMLVHSDSEERTREITREVLGLIAKFGFKASRQKAQLVQTKVKYLGLSLGTEGRTPDSQRVEVIAKLPAPTDTHSLRALLGTFNFSRDFIESFADKARPLYELLKKNAQWEWGPRQQRAFAELKRSLASAPALAHPDMTQPFYVQLATSDLSMGATLSQEQTGTLRVVAYASRSFSSVETKFSPCEKECLALVWALTHWEFIIGGSKVIVQSTHTPLKYIISGRVQNGQVTNARIAQWTLALVNRGVDFKKEQKANPAPYGLIVTGEEHECPLPPLQKHNWPVSWGASLAEAQLQGFVCWFCDGSSMHVEGSPQTGFGAIRVHDSQGLTGLARPHSSQAAEVEALKAILEFEPPDKPLAIYTDSDWTAKAATVWLPVWLENGCKNADGKPIAHKEKWLRITELIKGRTAPTWVTHIKGHQRNASEECRWNNRADALAKEAALFDPGLSAQASDFPPPTPVAPVVTRQQRRVNPPLLDLATLQEGDPQVQELAAAGKDPTGKLKIVEEEGIVWAEDTDKRLHWIVPTDIRGDLIQFAHEQGHRGKEVTLERVKETGWWPAMRKDVEQWVDNCLACAMVNADSSGPKAGLQHQRIEGPWARLQIDFIGPLPVTSKNNKYCLTIVDPFSKWVEALPCKNNTAATTARLLFDHVFSRFGLPKTIDSDSGSHFIGEVTKELCKALGIQQRFHIAGHPEASGAIERTNRTLKEALRKMVKSSGKDWDVKLPIILMAIRGTRAVHGYSPHQVMTGRKMVLPENLWLDTSLPTSLETTVVNNEWVRQLVESIEALHKEVAIHLGVARQRVDKRLGWVRNLRQWEVGTKVMYRNFYEKDHVLTAKWLGPVSITKRVSPAVYQVSLPRKGGPKLKFFHCSQLKEWKGKQAPPSEGQPTQQSEEEPPALTAAVLTQEPPDNTEEQDSFLGLEGSFLQFDPG